MFSGSEVSIEAVMLVSGMLTPQQADEARQICQRVQIAVDLELTVVDVAIKKGWVNASQATELSHVGAAMAAMRAWQRSAAVRPPLSEAQSRIPPSFGPPTTPHRAGQSPETLENANAQLASLPPDTLLTAEDLGMLLGRHKKSIQRSTRRGDLPAPIRMFGKNTWTAGIIREHVEKRLAREAKLVSRQEKARDQQWP